MKSFGKKINLTYLSIFVPLTAASFVIGGATLDWTIVTALGVGAIVWRWVHN